MKRFVMLSLCALLALATPAPMTGCSFLQETEPTQVVVDVGASYLAVTNTLNAARASGEIDYETWHNTINPAIQEGRAVYSDMNQAVRDGNVTRAQVLEAVLNGIVDRLTLYSIQAQGTSP